jgi:hypothetical protein
LRTRILIFFLSGILGPSFLTHNDLAGKDISLTPSKLMLSIVWTVRSFCRARFSPVIQMTYSHHPARAISNDDMIGWVAGRLSKDPKHRQVHSLLRSHPSYRGDCRSGRDFRLPIRATYCKYESFHARRGVTLGKAQDQGRTEGTR